MSVFHNKKLSTSFSREFYDQLGMGEGIYRLRNSSRAIMLR